MTESNFIKKKRPNALISNKMKRNFMPLGKDMSKQIIDANKLIMPNELTKKCDIKFISNNLVFLKNINIMQFDNEIL